MKALTKEEMADLKAEKRSIRQEMKQAGIKRTSCFNGGLSAESYRLNARLFAVETKLGK